MTTGSVAAIDERLEAPAARPSFIASAARWAIVLATTPLLLSIVCLLGLVAPRAARSMLGLWCRYVLFVFGIEVEVHSAGASAPLYWNRKGILVVADVPCVYVQLNQGSLLDGAIWMVAVPRSRGIVNIEYALLPFVGWATAASGAVVVVRQWAAQAHRAIARAEALLRRGERIAISIEGRRSVDGSLMPYKKGPAILAIRAGAPVVPVFFSASARECLPYGEWRVRPTRVRVTLCGPIATTGLTMDDRDVLIARLRRIAEDLTRR